MNLILYYMVVITSGFLTGIFLNSTHYVISDYEYWVILICQSVIVIPTAYKIFMGSDDA